MIVIGGVASTREREKERERERSASIRPPGHASCRRARKYIFSPSVRRATARQTDKYTFFEEISKRRLLRSESLEWRKGGREGEREGIPPPLRRCQDLHTCRAATTVSHRGGLFTLNAKLDVHCYASSPRDYGELG